MTVFLLNVLSAFSSASLAAAFYDDAVGLIQVMNDVSKRGQKSGSCDCIGWYDAYTKHNVKCGQGRELNPVVLRYDQLKNEPGVQKEFCTDYFEKLPNDAGCHNVYWSSAPATWCYVDASCESGLATQGQSSLKTKACAHNQDTILGERSFEDLAMFAHVNKVNLGLMVQYAYPTWDPEKLPDVQEYFGLPRGEGAQAISNDLRSRLTELRDISSSSATLFGGAHDGHPPYGVIEGDMFFWINFNPHGNVSFDLHDQAHPKFLSGGVQWTDDDDVIAACADGCGLSNVPTW